MVCSVSTSSLATRVRQARLEAGLTQAQLAGSESGFSFRGAAVGEVSLDELQGLSIHVCAHLGDTYRKPVTGHFIE